MKNEIIAEYKLKPNQTISEKRGHHVLVTEYKDKKGIIRRSVETLNLEPSMTQQQFAEESDANLIIKKYGTTGIDPFTRKDGYYADLTEVPDLQTALQTVKHAEEAFQSLSSEVRERFGNDPSLLMNFLKDPENKQEGIKLGLFQEPEKEKEPIKVQLDPSSLSQLTPKT